MRVIFPEVPSTAFRQGIFQAFFPEPCLWWAGDQAAGAERDASSGNLAKGHKIERSRQRQGAFGA